MNKRTDGKLGEKRVRKALQVLVRTKKVSFHRLADSRSAGYGSGGNLLAENPADFLVCIRGTALLLEVKSSLKYLSLKALYVKDYFSAGQIKDARLWARAGALPVVVFFAESDGTFEIWSTGDICQAYLLKTHRGRIQGQPLIKDISEADLHNAINTTPDFGEYIHESFNFKTQ